jgi:hypothetical protein
MAKLIAGGNGNAAMTANRKIVSVNKRQGFGNMGDQQGTTRVIYDSVLLATTAVNTTVRLFEGAKTRQFPLTNLSENKLQAKESIAMERFSVFILQCATGTTNLQGCTPLGYWAQFGRLYGGVMNFSIAQDQVIKKLPLSSMFAPLNKDSKFFGYYQIQALAADPVTSFQYPQDVYNFDNPIVIPPMIEFYADITIPPVTMPAGSDFYLCMRIEGLGSLYAPKATY